MTQIDNDTAIEKLDGLRRRRLMRRAGMGVASAAILAAGGAGLGGIRQAHATSAVTDVDIANFALNLEYLEAEFYLRGAYGHGLSDGQVTGTGKLGAVTGGSAVPFKTPALQQYAKEIAREEQNHVNFLRKALGSAAVARPAIDLRQSFTDAAIAAGLIKAGQTFDPFAGEEGFLIGSFLFEDVGVTAYHGAAGLISDKTILSAAAGILAVEAYHAGMIRTLLYGLGLNYAAQKIVILRKTASGAEDDYGLIIGGQANIVDADLTTSIAFARTTSQVINIVTLGQGGTGKGGFFPAGLNGTITT